MIEIQRKILELAEAGRAFAVATVAEARGSVPGKPGAKLVVEADGTCTGTVGGAGLEEKIKALCRRAIGEGKGGLHGFDLQHYKEGALDSLCGGSVTVFVEVHVRVPHLLICGGGHCGLEVARASVPLGWMHSVVDDRADYVARDRFPKARQLVHAGPEDFLARGDLSPYTHALLVGWSHRIDTELLFGLATRFPGWIGLIASRSKRAEMYRRLKARGLADSALERVVAPVGLSIGAETPAEIAVSIVAQIVADVRKPAPAPAREEAR